MITRLQVLEVFKRFEPSEENPRNGDGFCQYATEEIVFGEDGVSMFVPSCVIGTAISLLDRDVFAEIAQVKGAIGTILDWPGRRDVPSEVALTVAQHSLLNTFTSDALRLMSEVQALADRNGCTWGDAIEGGLINARSYSL